jgi:hypothetical protein
MVSKGFTHAVILKKAVKKARRKKLSRDQVLKIQEKKRKL